MNEDPLNIEGDKFYRKHFGKRFRFVKHIIVKILDTVHARFRHPMLVVLLVTVYVANVANDIIGAYDVPAACELYEGYVSPGRYF